MKQVARNTAIVLVFFSIAGCTNGIFGKKGIASINQATAAVNQLNTSVVHSADSVTSVFAHTRDSLLYFLRNHSEAEAHDISIGILKGTIGYLSTPQTRDDLAHFLDSVITHTGASTRTQLVQFKNQLLDPIFISQVQQLLRGMMHELVVRPTDDLLDVLTNDTRQHQISSLLRMVIPAALNDSAINQINKLRTALLGLNMKKDIASWVDTALIVVNARLDTPLKKTIHAIVEDNTSTIRKDAGWIIAGLVVLAIAVGLIIYFVQRKKVLLNKKMLHYVTLQIEQMKYGNEADYEQLTRNIQHTMQNHQLERQLNQFLKEEKIS